MLRKGRLQSVSGTCLFLIVNSRSGSNSCQGTCIRRSFSLWCFTFLKEILDLNFSLSVVLRRKGFESFGESTWF